MEQQTFTRAEAERDVQIIAERLALLYYYFVKNLAGRYDEAVALEIAAEVIAEYGAECGRLNREKVEAQGLTNCLANHHRGGDLPNTGWHSELLANSAKEQVIKTSYCPLAATWQRYGAEKWGQVYCGVDPAKYIGYNPCLRCTTEKSLLVGDEYCLLKIEDRG